MQPFMPTPRLLLFYPCIQCSSQWVEKEVETAFEREAATGETVLIPIRLDSSVMDTKPLGPLTSDGSETSATLACGRTPERIQKRSIVW
jgi:hypothetical protein